MTIGGGFVAHSPGLTAVVGGAGTAGTALTAVQRAGFVMNARGFRLNYAPE